MEYATKFKQNKKFSWKQLYEIVSMCFFMLVFVVILFACYTLLNSKKKIGASLVFGYTMINITSESMLDAGFRKNDKAFIKHNKNGEYQVGDYIAFFNYTDPLCPIFSMVNETRKPKDKASTNSIVFHEVVAVYKDSNGKSWYATKGTNNEKQDSNIIYENYVIGEYVKTPKSFLNAVAILTSPGGILLFITAPSCIILFIDMYTFISILILLVESKKNPSILLDYFENSDNLIPALALAYIKETNNFTKSNSFITNLTRSLTEIPNNSLPAFLSNKTILIPCVKLWEGVPKNTKQRTYYFSVYNKIIKTTNREDYTKQIHNIKSKDLAFAPKHLNDYITVLDLDSKTFDVIVNKEFSETKTKFIKFNREFNSQYLNFILENKQTYFNKCNLKLKPDEQLNSKKFIRIQREYSSLSEAEFKSLMEMIDKEIKLYHNFKNTKTAK